MENRPLKRQQRTVGAIVKIPLEDGYHTYARILEVRTAFYDARTTEELPIDEIVKKPVLFVLTVYDTAVTQGYWHKISKAIPIEEKLTDLPPMYRQDILNPNKYTIFHKGKEYEATKEQCIGLESFSVWNYYNVEKRLKEYYANRVKESDKEMSHSTVNSYAKKDSRPQIKAL